MSLLLLLHGLAYYGVLLLVAWQTGHIQGLRERNFWIKSGLGFLILCTYRAFPYLDVVAHWVPRELSVFMLRIVKYTLGWTIAAIPLFLIYLAYDRHSGNGFYGLKFRKVNFRPYAAMLLVVGPLAFFASFTESFLKTYPKYKPDQGVLFADFMGLPDWGGLLFFEIAYLSTFLFVELFFRGFLIIGLDKYLKTDVVLPMAATYAIFHFGKPLGETISSVFGGYLLGIFALKGRNIWGGVFIHMGIAFFMELFAYLQKYVF
ncbi:MAG: CPBP family intramembrane metalloprotease [Saprospirales bacterium]|nr:CPBP family intramembrane metalloprotease [Saprospirales bacterium]